MKTLKLSSIALALICLVSCTKSSNTLTEQASLRTSSNNVSNGNQDDVAPSLIVTFDPSTAVVNQAVTVTASFDATSGVAVPDCGKLQLRQRINGIMEKVADVDVSSSVHEVSFQLIPTIVGDDAYEFDVHYIAGNCAGFKQTMSESFFLDVVSACTGLSIEGVASAIPAEGEPGLYDFTVNYTVNTCGIEYDFLKTQGGVTAWTTDVTTLPATTSWPVGQSNHPNTITKWEETYPLEGNSKTYTLKFRKAWSGTGTVEITGKWSVKAELNGVEVGVAEFGPIVYPQ